MSSTQRSVTELLKESRAGDNEAFQLLVSLVYEELHRLAEQCMRGERPNHTLQATALVNEAYLRLVDSNVAWQDRSHFFAMAATTMRHVLVDHARAKGRQKRRGEEVSLEESLIVAPGHEDDILALDDALEALTEHDERAARVIELHYFGGLSYGETGEVLGVSAATVDRELRFARAWLARRMRE